MNSSPPTDRPLNPWLKIALELGPLAVFFVANQRLGLIPATGVFMVAIVVALLASFALTRRAPLMPLVSAGVVLVFGGLTLWLKDDTFIKIKPTIVNILFGLVLLGGLWFGRSLLSIVLDSVLHLSEEGWRKLTLRWALFFFALAALNELIWRTQTNDFWVNFKVFGIMPLTILFALAQTPLIMRHELKQSPNAGDDGRADNHQN